MTYKCDSKSYKTLQSVMAINNLQTFYLDFTAHLPHKSDRKHTKELVFYSI